MFGLDYLLGEFAVEDFIQQYWGKKALHIPGSTDRYDGLFGWEDINHASRHTRSNKDGLKLVYEKKGLAQAELAKMDHWLHKGATLICNNVNDIDPVVDRFTSTLEKDLNTPININSYTSCPAKQGFDKHYDQHDVFIVQTEGTKRWVVYPATVQYPIHEQGNPNLGDPPESDPYLDIELTRGDVLYIPRGHWHYAVATSPSIHLTIGPVARSASQFLMWMSTQLMNNDAFYRQDFPLIDGAFLGGKRDDADFDSHLNELRDRLTKLLEFDELKEAYVRYCMTTNPLKKYYQYPDGWLLRENISEDTAFTFPWDQKVVVRYQDEKQKAIVYCRGYTLILDAIPESFLVAVFQSPENIVTGKRILAHCKEVDWKTVKRTLLNLFENGVLILYRQDEEWDQMREPLQKPDPHPKHQ